jgi:hypothetical protein
MFARRRHRGLSDIQLQVIQAMYVGSAAGIWGPVVMDLDRQKVLLNQEMAAKKVVCAGPKTRNTRAPSKGAAKPSAGARGLKANQGKVDKLTLTIARHPRDLVALHALGDLYFKAKD